jgi:hypothetical protein
MDKSYFVYPFTSQQTFGLLPTGGYYKSAAENINMQVFTWTNVLISLGQRSTSGIARS